MLIYQHSSCRIMKILLANSEGCWRFMCVMPSSVFVFWFCMFFCHSCFVLSYFVMFFVIMFLSCSCRFLVVFSSDAGGWTRSRPGKSKNIQKRYFASMWVMFLSFVCHLFELHFFAFARLGVNFEAFLFHFRRITWQRNENKKNMFF